MDRKAAERIIEIQERILSDMTLMGEYKALHGQFLIMLYELDELQQSILMDYLGVCIELHLRILEEATK